MIRCEIVEPARGTARTRQNAPERSRTLELATTFAEAALPVILHLFRGLGRGDDEVALRSLQVALGNLSQGCEAAPLGPADPRRRLPCRSHEPSKHRSRP